MRKNSSWKNYYYYKDGFSKEELKKIYDGVATIPFNETRTYVKNVLANAVFYGTVYTGKAHSLKEKLGTLRPTQAVSSNLP